MAEDRRVANGGGAQPQITDIAPRRGPATGGTQVRITGSGFNGASKVSFGGLDARVFQVNSDTEILATTPAAPPGDAVVVVTGPTGASPAGTPAFEFVPAPMISSAKVEKQGDVVVIHGAALVEVHAVTFVQTVSADDDPDAAPDHVVRTPATSVELRGDGSLRVTRAPGPAGPADVVVNTAGGDSAPFSVSFPVRASRVAIFWLSVVYLVLLLGGMIAYLQWDAFPTHLPSQIGPVPLAVPWFGALGAVTLSLYGVLWHRVDWDPTYVLWHVVRPLMGVVLGTIAFLLLAGGIVASGGQPSGTANTAPAPTTSPTPSASASRTSTSTSTSSAPTTPPPGASPSASVSTSATATTTTTTTTTTSAGGTSPTNPFNNIFYDLVAFLVGFRESTFRVLIQRLADIIASPGAKSGNRPAGGTPAGA
jgi:hypothetical protein